MSNKYPGGIITSGANAGYSVFFDGTGDSLNTASNAAFGFGTGDFTVEFWIYPVTSAASKSIYHGSVTNSFVINSDASGKFVVRQYGVADLFTSTTAMTANAWNHVAVSRSGTTISGWLNGSRSDGFTGTNSTSWATTAVYLGSADTGVNYITGYMSNVRVVKGTAVYDPTQTTIRVPTQLLNITNTSLLTCNSPAIVDQSSNNFTITANGNAAVSTFTPFTGTQLVPNPNTLANTQGVWSISDAAYWMSQNKWPMPPNYPLQSLRFNSADSTVLSRTPGSAGSQTTWTWSGWIKRSVPSGSDIPSFFSSMYSSVQNRAVFDGSDKLSFIAYNGSSFVFNLVTTQVFRDFSSWYHLVLTVDSTNATSTNRVRIYVNGTRVTALDTATYPTQNANCLWNGANAHQMGGFAGAYLNGYMADINFVDGQALEPTSFGANDPNTGVWSPVPYSGTYGTNGFRLSFQNNTGTTATTLGKDYSGNGNNWTPNNFSVAAGSGNDSLTDGPTNWGIDYGNGGEVRGNFCTLNALQFAAGTMSDGNLKFVATTTSWVNAAATIYVSSGKWYWEFTKTGDTYVMAGVATNAASLTEAYSGSSTTTWTYSAQSGNKLGNGADVAYGATWAVNDVIGVALDMDAGTLTFYKNGVSQGVAFTTGLSGKQVCPWVGAYAANAGGYVNFGQRPFAYPAPPGFKVLCTTNLPIPTVGATSTTLANDYFDAVIYTGNGSSPRTISSLEFQPDMVWVKNRSISLAHTVHDVIRGTGTNKALYTNSTASESAGDTSLYGYISAFTSNGFTATAGSSSQAYFNTNNENYVAWNWKANGAGVSNTAGAITSTVSASTTAGFSIVTWTGNGSNSDQTVGTGLSTALDFIITKPRDTGAAADSWLVYTSAVTLNQNECFILNSTSAKVPNADQGTPSRGATAGLLLLRAGTAGNQNLNKSAVRYVSYCFHQVAGFSKFGSYTGNGSADGVFVYLGFRPRFIMGRDATGVDNWWIYDSARNTYNVANSFLRPNLADAEGSNATDVIDFLSNGFKIRGASNFLNENGNTFIYAAFAESPFNYSRAR